jgi:hypothetical protein
VTCCCSVACISAQPSSASSCPTLAQAHEKNHFRRLHFYFPSLPSDEWRTHELALPTIPPPPPAHLFSLHCLFPRSHSHLAVLPCDWTLQHVTSEVRVCATPPLLLSHPRVALPPFTSHHHPSLSRTSQVPDMVPSKPHGLPSPRCVPPFYLTHSHAHARACACACACMRVCAYVCVCNQPATHASHTRLPTTTERALCARASLNTI